MTFPMHLPGTEIRKLRMYMHQAPNTVRLILVVLGVFQAFDLRRALKSGRARVWPGGWATREHRPKIYWTSIYSAWIGLMLCIAVLVAMSAWPDFFR